MSSANRNLPNRPRRALDFYATPAWSVAEVYAGGGFPVPTLDPCAGTGALLLAAPTTRGVELQPGLVEAAAHPRLTQGDGLALDWHSEHIVINPPYADAMTWIAKGVVEAYSIHALVRVGFLCSQRRRRFFEDHPPAAVTFLSKRPSFFHSGPDAGRTDSADYCWIFWDSGAWAGITRCAQLGWIGGKRGN